MKKTDLKKLIKESVRQVLREKRNKSFSRSLTEDAELKQAVQDEMEKVMVKNPDTDKEVKLSSIVNNAKQYKDKKIWNVAKQQLQKIIDKHANQSQGPSPDSLYPSHDEFASSNTGKGYYEKEKLTRPESPKPKEEPTQKYEPKTTAGTGEKHQLRKGEKEMSDEEYWAMQSGPGYY